MLRYIIIALLSINSLYSQVQFQVPGITVSPSNTIDLPVTIQTNGNVLGSLEFALNYDQSILQFSEIILSEKAQTWLTYTMDTGNGKVRWGGYDKTHGQYSITNPTELFILKFIVLNPNWTTTPITVGRKTAGNVQGWDIAVANTDGYINYNRYSAPLDEDGINGRAYPVPTNDIVTLDLSLPVSGDYNIIIYDLNGSILHNRKQRFAKGDNSIQETLQSYPSGIYLLQITNTKFVKTFKIIKN
jgi:hypothetical protein